LVRKTTTVGNTQGTTAKLGAKALDTDSWFDDFDEIENSPDPEPEPEPAPPTRSSHGTMVEMPAPAPKKASSSKYSYTEPSLFADDVPFGMQKPKDPDASRMGLNGAPKSQQSTTESSGSRTKTVKASSSSSSSDESDYARKKFADAKAISSDMYFSEDKVEEYDPEKEARLSRFNGSRAISSADYFERDESSMSTGSSVSDTAMRVLDSAVQTAGQLFNQAKDAAAQWF